MSNRPIRGGADAIPRRREEFILGWPAQILAFMRSTHGASLILAWTSIGAARLAGQFVDNPEVADSLVAIAALPLLAIVPWQIGAVGLRLLANYWEISLNGSFVLAWLIGVVVVVFGLVLVTEVGGVPAPVAVTLLLLGFTAVAVYGGFTAAEDPGNDPRHQEERLFGRTWLVLAVVVMVAYPLTMIRAMQPYPLLEAWGMFNLNFRVLEFVQADVIPFSPGIHTPVHAALYGTSSLATGADSMGAIWATPFLLYGSFALGMFALGRRLVGSDLLALVAVWIGIWVLSFQAFQHLHGVNVRAVILAIFPWVLLVMHDQLAALPARRDRTWLYVLAPFVPMAGIALIRWFFPSVTQVWALLLVLGLLVWGVSRLPSPSRPLIGVLSLIGVALTLLHFIEGPLFFAVGVSFLTLLHWRPVSVQWRVALGGLFIVTVAFILVQAAGLIEFGDESMITRLLLGSGRADATDISFVRKLELIRTGLAIPILALLGLSAARNMIWPNGTHLASLAVIAAATFLFVLPESGTHRMMAMILPMVAVSVALEIKWWADTATLPLPKHKRMAVTAALILAAVVALTPSLMTSLRSQMGLPSRYGFVYTDPGREFSNISAGEYDVSQWIEAHVPQEWAVVSDPITMFYIEGLTQNPQVAKTRAWVSESEYSDEDQARLRSLEPRVFGAPSVVEAMNEMELLTADHPGYVLVITHRTLDWLVSPDPLFRRAKATPQVLIGDVSTMLSWCAESGIEGTCPAAFFDSTRLAIAYLDDGAILIPQERVDELRDD